MTPATVTRRAAMGTMALGAAALLAFKPEPRGLRPAAKGRTIIDYWEKWTGPEGDAVQHLVDTFNDSQSRIFVRRVPVSDILNKAMVAIGGGDPPDIVGLYSYSLAQFAEAGAAMPVDTDVGIDPSIYAPNVRRLLTHEGRVWAGVTSIYAQALYCNAPAFREAGLDPTRLPRTIAELDDASERLTRRGRDGEIERAGFLPTIPAWWPYIWPVMFGGKLFEPGTSRVVLTDEPTINAYEWVKRTAARVGIEPARHFAEAYAHNIHSARDPFISGACAMVSQGPWIASFIKRHAPTLEFVVTPLPVDPATCDPRVAHGMLEADILVVPRGCPHPDAAFEFLRFSQTQEAQESLASAHGKSSPLALVSPAFTANHPNPFVGVHDAITRSPATQILPQTRAWQAYSDLLFGAFDEIWRGGDVRRILASVETRAQAMVDQAAARRAARAGARHS